MYKVKNQLAHELRGIDKNLSTSKNSLINLNEIFGDRFRNGKDVSLNYGIEARMDRVTGVIPFTVQGRNDNIESTEEQLTNCNTAFDVIFIASDRTLSIASSSVNDTIAGTGARVIQILGLNSTFDEITENVVLNGNTVVNTTHTFTAINRCIVISVGSGGFNDGYINISDDTDTFTTGTPDNRIYQCIAPNINVALTMLYTVPRNYRYLPVFLNLSTDATDAKVLTTYLYIKFSSNLPEFNIGKNYFTASSSNTEIPSINAIEEYGTVRMTGNSEGGKVNQCSVNIQGFLINTTSYNV